ncbi:uncharacterized protein LOC112233418 isoform X2 [Oncorhynchus tshawytscha]|uniref:uncharacterized protein LOC112233418 isoform X2 n=1 Tax=Oncorhynchus tshawytscha TaxID=74940 RepID=UPI000D0A3D5F|nr:uncharacterized protein LOC112233418 isoform X2 [Oncorhynchus tshawytscha]
MEENEALENYCRRMITQVNNQLNPETAGERGWRERQEERGEEGERTALRVRGRKGLQSEVWRRMIIQIHRKQNTETTAASERQKEKTVRRQRECEDLAGEPVPIQLISALKMKTFTEEMRRDAVCLLGELLRGLPKPSDAPSGIWEQLQARGRQQLGVTLETEQESGCTQTRERQSGVTLMTVQELS